jgi:hypothetical protein
VRINLRASGGYLADFGQGVLVTVNRYEVICIGYQNRSVNGAPFNFTVSRPTWIRISAPSSVVRPRACLVSITVVTTASATIIQKK